MSVRLRQMRRGAWSAYLATGGAGAREVALYIGRVGASRQWDLMIHARRPVIGVSLGKWWVCVFGQKIHFAMARTKPRLPT